MSRKRISRVALLLAAIVGLLAGSWFSSRWALARSEAHHARAAAPRLLLAEKHHDLGTAAQGAVLRTVFPIRNVGTRRLILVEQGQGCCGAAEKPPPIMIPPGDTEDVVVEVDTSQWHGRIKHTTRYSTNDPEVSHFALQVTASVD